MKVMKFGGTSVGSPARMKEVARLVSGQGPVVVVLSAMSGVTNNLVALHEQSQRIPAGACDIIESLRDKYEQTIRDLFPDPAAATAARKAAADSADRLHKAAQDGASSEGAVLAEGELVSTAIFTALLTSQGAKAALLPALDFMSIDAEGKPCMESIRTKAREDVDNALVRGAEILVTQGFICRGPQGEVTNLQRGGSDYTATLLGAALGADCVEIWTDIDGLHTSDPRVVEGTRPVRKLSYADAETLAFCGAKILHPLCVRPCREASVPLRLLYTMDPAAAGTLIGAEACGEAIVATAMREGVTISDSTAIRFKDSDDCLPLPHSLTCPDGTPVAAVAAVGSGCGETKAIIAEKLRGVTVLAMIEMERAAVAIVPQSDGAAALRAIAP